MDEPGFTLIELVVVIAIGGLLAAMLLGVPARVRSRTQRVVCLNNLRQFALADLIYADEHRELPEPHPLVPSSVSVERLTSIAAELRLTVPPGPAGAWPRRAQQPRWINCPLAVQSGQAEGVVLGGGLYTGYACFGGIENSAMVINNFASILHPGHAADRRNTRRGVLWTDVLDEFATDDPRRFEFFHARQKVRYSDFRFPAGLLEGIHRAWSDGSVEWVKARSLQLTGPESPDCRIQHLLGNYYF